MKENTMLKHAGSPARFISTFVLIIVCFLIQPANAKEKGFVTITTLGPSPITVSANTEPQQVVNRVIAHWKQHFSRVLPDKPDLIVVPEACDRPRGMSHEKQRDYYRVRKNQVRDYVPQVALENKCYIVYSAKRAEADGTWRNSSVMIDRKGKVVGIYSKNHPTIGENDRGILPAGTLLS
jgi:predicted amidohydrolase